MSDLDNDFMRQAAEAEAAEKHRQANRGQGGNAEFIKYSGFEKRTKLYRFIGNAWDFNLGNLVRKVKPHEARVVRVARLIDDKGKEMRLVLPLYDRDEGKHPLLRLIAKVNDGKWVPDPSGEIDKKTGQVKNIKIYTYQRTHAEVFEMINRSNIDPSDNRVKYGLIGKGWGGKEFFVSNVIDREMLEWHRANHHYVVASKNVNLGKTKRDDGTYPEFAEPGVPSYGFTMMLNSNFIKFYGSLETYDIGIERTGLTSPAYNMYPHDHPAIRNNATLSALVGAKGPLTEEERSWEPYDLDKHYGTTSFTRIWNRLQKSLAKVDAALNTGFAAEVKALADQEAVERKANQQVEAEMAAKEARDDAYEEADQDLPFDPEDTGKFSTPAGMDSGPTVAAPAPQARVIVEDEEVDPRDREKLPGWPKLRAEDREKVLSAVKEGETWNITYSVKARGFCQKCKGRSPETFESCPYCGASFTEF